MTMPPVAIRPTQAAAPPPFRGTLPSRADRDPGLRSRGSHLGSLVAGALPTRIVYESLLEWRVAVALLAQRGVRGLREQVTIPYVDGEGSKTRYTFDFLVSMDGCRLFVAVKYHDKAKRSDLRGLMRLIAPQIPASLADGIVILTERHLPDAMVRDAELIHAVRREAPGADDEAVMAAAGAIIGSVTIADLMAAAGRAGQGFRAIVRRIADGDLVLASPGPISHSALVALPGRAADHLPQLPGLTIVSPDRESGG